MLSGSGRRSWKYYLACSWPKRQQGTLFLDDILTRTCAAGAVSISSAGRRPCEAGPDAWRRKRPAAGLGAAGLGAGLSLSLSLMPGDAAACSVSQLDGGQRPSVSASSTVIWKCGRGSHAGRRTLIQQYGALPWSYKIRRRVVFAPTCCAQCAVLSNRAKKL